MLNIKSGNVLTLLRSLFTFRGSNNNNNNVFSISSSQYTEHCTQ